MSEVVLRSGKARKRKSSKQKANKAKKRGGFHMGSHIGSEEEVSPSERNFKSGGEGKDEGGGISRSLNSLISHFSPAERIER